MYLVLCDCDDLPALWAWRELSRRLPDVLLVTAEALAYAGRWEHRLDSRHTSTAITLADGRVIRSENVRGTLNRLLVVPTAHLRAAAAEREYAGAEWLAFFASWLHGLPGPMLNPATPSGLNGGAQWRDYAEWLTLAAQSGLEIEPYTESETTDPTAMAAALTRHLPKLRTMLVIDDRLIGPECPERVAAGCRALARRANLRLAGVDFDEEWVFRFATVMPDLRAGGQDAIDALAFALSARGECR